jgi:hypothetical protein
VAYPRDQFSALGLQVCDVIAWGSAASGSAPKGGVLEHSGAYKKLENMAILVGDCMCEELMGGGSEGVVAARCDATFDAPSSRMHRPERDVRRPGRA